MSGEDKGDRDQGMDDIFIARETLCFRTKIYVLTSKISNKKHPPITRDNQSVSQSLTLTLLGGGRGGGFGAHAAWAGALWAEG